MVNIALFGGTGAVGSAFAEYALEAKHSVVLQARTPTKVKITHEKLQIVQGDGTSSDDVVAICEGCDVIVSCAGNSRIMESLATNMVHAAKIHNIKRCYFVTSLGIGGSSPVVRFLLGCMVGWGNIHDYEAADKIILEAGFTTIRPTGLTDKGDPDGKYFATSKTGIRNGSLHKKDVALFICEEITNNVWGGKSLQLYAAK